ncbi:hypothetical protein FRB90_000147 [Tulasnella sp. 427]|nr:hypothetical protein FRB90_000147 [Tulasnella sp. 427]
MLDLPQSKYSLTWSKFGEAYGPLTWLEIPGQTFLVLNSMEAVTDLLEKKALNFIDRQRFTMVNELLGMTGYITFSPCNSLFKAHRALFKHPLSTSVVKTDYSRILELKSREYLERCLNHPENFLFHVNTIIAETVITITYGRLKDERGTDYVRANEHVMDIIIAGMEGYAVDLIPPLQYLPSWLPGMGFKRAAAQWRSEIEALELNMLGSVKESLCLDDPDVRSSFMVKKLNELYQGQAETKDPQQLADEEMSLNRAGHTIFLGGVETTRNTLETSILAISLFPEAQKKAQAEIDRVVGSGRLPEIADMPNLRYVHAVVLETLRWCPTVPFGIPHVSTKDEVYNGYFIPKGTTVIPNAWSITQNPTYYSNPSEFNPERHLKQPPELDPRQYSFGYGRRSCPGKELAFPQAWMMVVSILWAFELVFQEDDVEAWRERVDRYTFGLLK